MNQSRGIGMKEVLIVDDEESILFILDRILSISGYRVTKASDGDEAVEAANTKKFDLILLDLRMPKMDGIDVSSAIRNNGLSRQTPIIIVSAHSDPKNVDEAFMAGANDFIDKPFDTEIILLKAKKWVSAQMKESWNKLEPAQRSILGESIATLDMMFDSVKESGYLPYGEVSETGAMIANSMFDKSVNGVLMAFHEHDDSIFTHSFRMGAYLALFGSEYANLKGSDLIVLATGGFVHDVGRIKIPPEIINKRGSLNHIEMGIMRTHVDHSFSALINTREVPEQVLEITSNHHERNDGSGYPYGLTEPQIGKFGQMAGIVDIFTALTEKRIYRPRPYTPHEAFEIIEQEGGRLNLELAGAFKEIFLARPPEAA